MPKSKKYNSVSSYIKKLNEIDINALISSLKNINFKDLKKIDINHLSLKIKKSSFFKPTIGLLGASILFTLLLVPSFEQLISSFNKSRKYQEESNALLSQRLKIKKLDEKIYKSNLFLSELNESIISKDDIIFISKLINQTALKSNVNVISIIPVEAARSGKLCRQPNQARNSIKSNKIKNRKGSFQENFFEINLLSNYLDLIKFLNIIQYYDVVMLPSCLEVLIANDNRYSNTNSDDTNNIESSKIIALSESGIPLIPENSNNKLDSDSSFNKVEIRLVLKIPSHSR